MDKDQRKAKIDSMLKPKRFFDELAEYGYLLDFLKTRFPYRFENDPDFRAEMYDILYQHSPAVIAEVEVIYLEKLCETMSYFLEFTKLWRIQKH